LTNEADSSCELMQFPEVTFDADDAAGVATLSEADAFDRSWGPLSLLNGARRPSRTGTAHATMVELWVHVVVATKWTYNFLYARGS